MDKVEDGKITLTIKEDYDKYINFNRYFGLPFVVFLLTGGRGIGKTTGFNITAIKQNNKNGSEFVMVRRYASELSKIKTSFDSIASGITTHGLGKGAFEYRYKHKRIGYGLTLATFQAFKSGMDFSKVNLLCFDEAILMPHSKLSYLPNEVTSFLELISTIFRDKKKYRIFILGNNLDIFNPYFEYFKIPKFKDTYTDSNRGIYCEMVKDKKAFIEASRETPLAKLTQGTQYWDYHYKNEVLDTNPMNIDVKGDKDYLLFRMIVNGKTINFYYHSSDTIFAELRDKVINDDLSMTIMSNGKVNYYFMRMFKSSDIGKMLSAKYYKNKIVVNSSECSVILTDIMQAIK